MALRDQTSFKEIEQEYQTILQNSIYGTTKDTALVKLTAVQNEVASSYHKMREIYFLAVIFTATEVVIIALAGLPLSLTTLNLKANFQEITSNKKHDEKRVH